MRSRTQQCAPAAGWLEVLARATLGALLLALPLAAQDAGAKDGAEEDPPAEVEAQATTYASPRAVLKAFFDAMEKGDVARATTTFPPDPTRDAGDARALAAQLYDDVFVRTRFIDVGELLPDDVSGDYTFVTWPEGDRDFELPIRFVEIDGAYYFSRSTLASVDEWTAELTARGASISKELMEGMSELERLRLQLRTELPDALKQRTFVIENWQWLGLLLLCALAVLIDRISRVVASRVVHTTARRMNARAGAEIDADVMQSFARPAGVLAGVVAFELLLPVLGVDSGLTTILVLATSLIAAVAGVWAIYRMVDVVCDFLEHKASATDNKFDDMLVPLLRRTLKVFVFVAGVLFVASRISGDVWSVVAGLGLGSVALALAGRDSVENLFGTFTVLLDKPFQIGDWIIVGDLEGTVELVGLRSTRIRTFYNSLITVPNREFIAAAVDNMGERKYRRIKTTLSLTYDTPPEKIEAFCEGVRELIRSHPYTRKDYYHVYLNGFGASSLDVLLYCFVETPEWGTELREKHRLFADVLRLAEQLGVSFAFPSRSLYMVQPEQLEHADRPDSDVVGASRGIEVAHRVAAKTLEPYGGVGSVPPAVRTITRPVYGDDGADGG